MENAEALQQGNGFMVREVARMWILHFEGETTV